MSTVLVLGASGAIGRPFVPRLLAAGHDVIALSRTVRAARVARLRWVQADIHAPAPALPRVDAIFSLGPLDGLAAWLATLGGGADARLIAFGSMSLLAKRDSIDPAERVLAARLAAAEQALVDAAASRCMAWTLFRPTLIYGSGLDRSLSPLARFGRRWRVFPRLPAATGLRQPVHAEDLAEACLAAWATPASHGRTYALGGGERLPFADMLERVRGSLGVCTLGVPLPLAGAAALARGARALGLPAPGAGAFARLRENLVADDGPARRDLGWSPRGFDPGPSTWSAPGLPEY